MNNTSKFTTVLLVFLTVLRALGTGAAGVLSFQAGANQNVYVGIVSLLFSLLYIIGIVGIFTKRKAAIAALIFLGVLDLLSAFQIGGANGFGAGLFDAIIVYLAYLEYRNASLKAK
jgi:hypothetical protein